jgi:hypothetical protein
LFITKIKQEAQAQYENYFEGDLLCIEGDTNQAADDRMINAASNGDEL